MEQARYDPTTGIVDVRPISVALPKRRKRDLPWLLILAFFVPPLAVYLDGASASTFNAILFLWILGIILWIPLPFAVGWAIIYLFRSSESRRMSRPARYRLWVQSPEGKKPFEEAPPYIRPEHNTAPTVPATPILQPENTWSRKSQLNPFTSPKAADGSGGGGDAPIDAER